MNKKIESSENRSKVSFLNVKPYILRDKTNGRELILTGLIYKRKKIETINRAYVSRECNIKLGKINSVSKKREIVKITNR
jgi:hypothetical protein